MGVPSFPSAELLLFWGGVQQDIAGFSHDPVEYAPSVTCRTLVLHGDQDRRAQVNQARAVFDALGTSRKTWKVFSGVAHESYVRAQPEAWRATVGELLGTLP